MRIIQRIINDGHGSMSPTRLVIHETANTGASALNHVSYWKGNPNVPMTHYVLDWTGCVYHCVPDDRVCWHVGNANGWTVGVELCHATDATRFAEVWDTAVDFAVHFLNSRGWSVNRMVSHAYCSNTWGGSDHQDPLSYFAEYGRTWQRFVDDVRERMAEDMPTVDDIWNYEINGYSAKERLRLCNVKDYESKDMSGRGRDCDDHTRLCWMAAKQETMQDNIDDIRRVQAEMNAKLDAIIKSIG